ncbi:hypothetical protein BH11PSE7_BH11PSE7_13690 [soil metagenome]
MDSLKPVDSNGLGIAIVLGVTGHRDMADAEGVRRLLRQEIARLQAIYPHSPFTGLSSLAEGADRLFADVILELGMPLYVPLPLVAADYEKDFPETVPQFRQLCGQARLVFEVPGANAGLSRELQYARAGMHVSQRAHILFALWDGQPARGLGGTGQIVNLHRTGQFGDVGDEHSLKLLAQDVSRSSLDEWDQGLVCHIHVERSRAAEGHDVLAPPTQPHVEWLYPKGPGPSTAGQEGGRDGLLLKMDRYNAELHALDPLPPAAPRASNVEAGQDDAVTREYERMVARFNATDHVANQSVQSVRGQFKWLFGLAAVMVWSHEMYADLFPTWHWLLLYLLLMGSIGLIVRGLRSKHKNSDAIDKRALSEALRVQAAWFRAGVPDMVAKNYLRRDSGHLLWVRRALIGVSPALNARAQAGQVEAVKKDWVDGQLDYFRGSVSKRRHVIESMSRRGAWLFRLGVVIACVVLALRVMGLVPEHHAIWVIALDMAIGLLPAWAALMSGYIEFAAYEDDVREHERMERLFDTASRRMADIPLHDQQQVIRDLGVEALHETASWALLHKSHEARAPG